MATRCSTPRPSLSPRRRRPVALAAALMVVGVLGACGGGGTGRRSVTPPPRPEVTATMTPPPPTLAPPATVPRADLAEVPCQGTPPPARYAHVVVVMMENRSWGALGGPGFPSMPYLAGLASRCAFYADWVQTNPAQSSLTQYIGLTSGVDNPRTVDDCAPSPSCTSTDDNLFRQVRQAGGTARTYVEGATEPCSAAGNAAKHIPALYYHGAYTDASGPHTDDGFCVSEVRPLSELDPDHLPTFAMVVPDQCHDGHDCPNATVDEWASVHVRALLAGADYRAGTTAVLVLWDEYRPVPNLLVAPGALAGPRPGSGSHAAALKTIELMLGLPVLAQGQLLGAADLRASSGL